MLDNVTANDLVEFVVGERIWKRSEIVNDICVTQAIRIDADRTGKLVLTTPDIENLSAFGHRSVFAQQTCQLFQIEGVNRSAQPARHFGHVHAVQHYRFVTLQHLKSDEAIMLDGM